MSSAHDIDANAVRELLATGACYLDVRTVEEFDLGHIPGAYNVPLDHGSPSGLAPNPDFARVVEANFDKSQRLIVGCHSGGRAARAMTRLTGLAFENIACHRAGWDGTRDAFGRKSGGWVASGGATQVQATEGRSYARLLTNANLVRREPTQTTPLRRVDGE